MKQSHSVSIAMATYNGAKFIKEQLDSLAKQTYLPAELIITDDNSTDETLDIAAAFATTAPFPVRIEKNPERLGYKANFLKAASLCNSDLIAFCDQDDVWLHEKLSACLASFDSKDVMLTYHNATAVAEDLTPLYSLQAYAAPQPINPAFSISPWHFGLGFTLVFRRSLLNFTDYWPLSTDFFDIKNREAHDQWIFFLASSLGIIGYIDQPLVLYRQHAGNAFGWKNNAASIKAKIYNLMTTKIEGIRSYEYSCMGRAKALELIAEDLDAGRRTQVEQSSLRYRKLASYYKERTQMYCAKNPGIRLWSLLGLIIRGAYRPKSSWGVGPQALMRDIFRGLIFPAQ